mmetsp:Transcript_36205/g.94853  ORF Transcript_36205/g.94853 Transcript_36205/m.94853 type:complete len:279 (+) Transcript_36205:429-1265(+)
MVEGGWIWTVVEPAGPRATGTAGVLVVQVFGTHWLISLLRLPASQMMKLSPSYPRFTSAHGIRRSSSPWALASPTVIAYSSPPTLRMILLPAGHPAVRDTAWADWVVESSAIFTVGRSGTTGTSAMEDSGVAGLVRVVTTASPPDAVEIESVGVLANTSDTPCSSWVWAVSASAPSPPEAAAVAGSGSMVMSACITGSLAWSRRPLGSSVSLLVPGTATTLIRSGESPSSTARLVRKFSPLNSASEIWMSICNFTVGVLRITMSCWPSKAAWDPLSSR